MNDLTEIVFQKHGKVLTNTKIIAEKLGKEHKHILKSVDDLIEKTTIDESSFRLTYAVDKSNREQRIYELTELGFSRLMMELHGDKAALWKDKFSTAFIEMRKYLDKLKTQQENIEWQQARNAGKLAYRRKTDIIKTFVEYATNQGSQNANKYYMVIESMQKKSLDFLKEAYSEDLKLRDFLDILELADLRAADRVCRNALVDGMNEGLHYKDIYKLAKDRILAFAETLKDKPLLLKEKENTNENQ